MLAKGKHHCQKVQLMIYILLLMLIVSAALLLFSKKRYNALESSLRSFKEQAAIERALSEKRIAELIYLKQFEGVADAQKLAASLLKEAESDAEALRQQREVELKTLTQSAKQLNHLYCRDNEFLYAEGQVRNTVQQTLETMHVMFTTAYPDIAICYYGNLIACSKYLIQVSQYPAYRTDALTVLNKFLTEHSLVKVYEMQKAVLYPASFCFEDFYAHTLLSSLNQYIAKQELQLTHFTDQANIHHKRDRMIEIICEINEELILKCDKAPSFNEIESRMREMRNRLHGLAETA